MDNNDRLALSVSAWWAVPSPRHISVRLFISKMNMLPAFFSYKFIDSVEIKKKAKIKRVTEELNDVHRSFPGLLRSLIAFANQGFDLERQI